MRIIIAVVLIGHGLGHGLGMLPAFGLTLSAPHGTDSWLLPESALPLRRWLAVAVWLLALGAFAAAGLALAGWGLPRSLWPGMGVAASLLSLAAIVVFPRGLPFVFPNLIGAALVDLGVLSAVWLGWPFDLTVV